MPLKTLEQMPDQQTAPAQHASNKLGRRSFLTRAVGGLTLGFLLPEISRIGEMQAAVPGQVNTWL